MIIKTIAATAIDAGKNTTNAIPAITISNPIPNTPINMFFGINTNAKIIPINTNQPILFLLQLSYHLNVQKRNLQIKYIILLYM